MIHEINVKALNRNYPIYIGENLRFNLYELIKPFQFSKAFILTDDHVEKLYLKDVIQSLDKNMHYDYYVMKHGESSKSFKTYIDIQTNLLNHQYDRDGVIIALGGGVVGDIGGFIASTYMRGIGFIQMPTTLLAHDSSIGGKVAINLNETKNIIGSFYPPHAVIYDTNTLKTLDEQQKRSGFAEMIKHGFLADETFLAQLKNKMDERIHIETDSFLPLLKQSIEIKQTLIETDERENNVRKFLNLGHTLGHAVEATMYNEYTHGECVMYGLLFALYVSDQQNDASFLLTDDLLAWIRRLNYPIAAINEQLNRDQVINKMLKDKKNKQNHIQFVLLKNIGKPYMAPFQRDQIKQLLADFQTYLKMNGVAQ